MLIFFLSLFRLQMRLKASSSSVEETQRTTIKRRWRRLAGKRQLVSRSNDDKVVVVRFLWLSRNEKEEKRRSLKRNFIRFIKKESLSWGGRKKGVESLNSVAELLRLVKPPFCFQIVVYYRRIIKTFFFRRLSRKIVLLLQSSLFAWHEALFARFFPFLRLLKMLFYS